VLVGGAGEGSLAGEAGEPGEVLDREHGESQPPAVGSPGGVVEVGGVIG
jgi:hypothetical protein